ncbi:MAG TPA: hypothetical protein VJ743_15155 [Albitalea sp.]|nr:hypothetical protein [Albitalea sp.]
MRTGRIILHAFAHWLNDGGPQAGAAIAGWLLLALASLWTLALVAVSAWDPLPAALQQALGAPAVASLHRLAGASAGALHWTAAAAWGSLGAALGIAGALLQCRSAWRRIARVCTLPRLAGTLGPLRGRARSLMVVLLAVSITVAGLVLTAWALTRGTPIDTATALLAAIFCIACAAQLVPFAAALASTLTDAARQGCGQMLADGPPLIDQPLPRVPAATSLAAARLRLRVTPLTGRRRGSAPASRGPAVLLRFPDVRQARKDLSL